MAEIKTLGRPSEYSEAIGDEICARMAGGESLHKIANDPDMPARSTILRWISKNEIFGRQYTAAREALQDYWWDKAMEVAFDGSGDIIIENGKTKVDNENVHRSRLKVDTIKWTLSKLNPRKFGDTPDLSADETKQPITKIERVIIQPGDLGDKYAHAREGKPKLLTYQPPGRQEKIEAVVSLLDGVDNAQTAEAVEAMLKALKPFNGSKSGSNDCASDGSAVEQIEENQL
jgi:hypothetical protein